MKGRWIAACVGVCAALLFAAGAQAVHDTGAFELDGNGVSANAAPPVGPTDDWDRVCHQVLPASCPSASNTTGSTAVDWIAEPSLTSSIFTTGGSKDPADVSSWQWKDMAGGLPDKD